MIIYLFSDILIKKKYINIYCKPTVTHDSFILWYTRDELVRISFYLHDQDVDYMDYKIP